MNLGACRGLNRSPENQTWYRAVNTKHLPGALSSSHTRNAKSRFSAGPLLSPADQFEVLYFASDNVTAEFELGAAYGDPRWPITNPYIGYTMLNVHVVLQNVVDLTDETAQKLLNVTAQELTGDWRGYETRGLGGPINGPVGTAPTQEIGRALFAEGIEGFRAISAKLPTNMILVVFPQHLNPGKSSLTYRDPALKVVHRIP